MRQSCDKTDESVIAPTAESAVAPATGADALAASGKIVMDAIATAPITGAARLSVSSTMVADAFIVHGHKNPEGGIRRWREAEYAEVAIKDKNLFPSGVPDNLSDNKLAEAINKWLNENTDWPELKRGEISRWTVRRVRKLLRD